MLRPAPGAGKARSMPRRSRFQRNDSKKRPIPLFTGPKAVLSLREI
jgi:hypothetical protein